MNKYLAKSKPLETIQEHTNNLIENYELLKKIYPNLNVNWDMLYLVCIYHDLGKMNLKFQKKIEGKKYDNTEIPHGILSITFFNTKKLKELGYSKEDIKIMVHAVAYHHDRGLNYDDEQLKEEIEKLKKETENFLYDKVRELSVKKISPNYFAEDRIYQKTYGEELFLKYVMLKGLLNRIDYAASAGIVVENKNDFLENGLNNMLEDWKNKKPESKWNELQEYMKENQDKNIITIAQTGMGKTEAGLLWIGNNKGFFTLPLRTAINAIYKRITDDIIKVNIDDKVALLHGDTYSKYLEKIDSEDMEIDIEEYYNKTKQWSLPLTVCTLDQVFDFVFRYRGFEPKLATLSYSKVVIDEIQMYSSDLLAYLILGLSYISKVGGKFAILTATLPNIVVDLLKAENIEFLEPKIFIKKDEIRHSIKILHEEININPIIEKYDNNKVLVICNTVKQAQKVYKELEEKLGKEKTNLLHARFLKKDRRDKEDQILKMGNKESKENGIWVTTQIVEASLDIDFDVLFTELSDLNGLFQRMGRCYRNRLLDKEYNCYVFDGGSKKCSGVGMVIDPDIFKFSKEALINFDGKITEQEKIDFISNLYTTEKLKETKYYEEVTRNIKWVKSITEFENSKSDIAKKFRNIDSTNVIPELIYMKNKKEIEDCSDFLTQPYNKELTEEQRKDLKKDKARKKNQLMDYSVNILSSYIKDGMTVKNVQISKYEKISILRCEYTEELGVVFVKVPEKSEKIDERIF